MLKAVECNQEKRASKMTLADDQPRNTTRGKYQAHHTF
jgi:hypothetical protein